MELVLYRQYTYGLFRIYRHSGQTNGRWRPVFSTTDEGEAFKKYEKIYHRWKQGGLRLVDPEGVVLQNAYAPPLNWGKRYR